MLREVLVHAGWPIALITGWALAYVVWWKPMQAKIVAVTGSKDQLADPTLTWWQRALIYLDGYKTLIGSFLLSMFSVVKTFLDTLATNTDILDSLKDIPWAQYVTPDLALKIVSFLLLVIPFFHYWGKLKAAFAEPRE